MAENNSHPINCSCHCLDLASCPLCIVCAVAKIRDLYLPSCFVQQNVVRLNVPMKDVLLVHVIHPFQYLCIGWALYLLVETNRLKTWNVY